MNRTSLLFVQLEDRRNPEGEKEQRWEDKAWRRSSPHWFSWLGQMPFSLQPIPCFISCIHLYFVWCKAATKKKNVNALVHTISHIHILITSWIFFKRKTCSLSSAITNAALQGGETMAFKAECVRLSLVRLRENQSNDTIWHTHMRNYQTKRWRDT